jgi:hypothetical protein
MKDVLAEAMLGPQAARGEELFDVGEGLQRTPRPFDVRILNDT